MQHHFTVKLIESVGEREREIKREQFHVICWEASLMCRRSVSSCLSRAVSQPRITTLNKHDYQLILQRSHKHEQMTLITSAGQEDTAAAVSQQHLSGFVMLDWNNNLLSLSPHPPPPPQRKLESRQSVNKQWKMTITTATGGDGNENVREAANNMRQAEDAKHSQLYRC